MRNVEARAQLMSLIENRCDSLSFLARQALGRRDNCVQEKEDGYENGYSFSKGSLPFEKGVETVSFSRIFLGVEKRLVLLIRLRFRDGSAFLITDATHKRLVSRLDAVGEIREGEENLGLVKELASRLQEISPYQTLLERAGQVRI